MRLSKSEFEKDELFDPNNIAALIDKSKEERPQQPKKQMLLPKIKSKI